MSENTATTPRLADLPPLRWAAKRLEDGLSQFVDSLFAEIEARQVVDDLLGRGWIDRVRPDEHDPEPALTSAGRAGFEAMRRAQDATWDVVLDGLTEADYVATVTAMTTMGDNLERANRARQEQSL